MTVCCSPEGFGPLRRTWCRSRRLRRRLLGHWVHNLEVSLLPLFVKGGKPCLSLLVGLFSSSPAALTTVEFSSPIFADEKTPIRVLRFQIRLGSLRRWLLRKFQRLWLLVDWMVGTRLRLLRFLTAKVTGVVVKTQCSSSMNLMMSRVFSEYVVTGEPCLLGFVVIPCFPRVLREKRGCKHGASFNIF